MALSLALLLTGNGFASPLQEVNVSGRVTSTEDGNGLPGVSIVVKGTQQGTISDADGRYTISVPDNASVLVFSFIGYTTQEILVNDRNLLDISLSTNMEQLDEVVVTEVG